MDHHHSIAANDGDQPNTNVVAPDPDQVGTTPSLVSTPTITSAPADSQAQHADVDMDDVEFDDMPGLQAVSDSSDSDYDDEDDDSDVDAREVEMQAMHVDDDDPPLLPLPDFGSRHAPSPSPSSRNRRARVEDDEDNDRDRRHPFHRIGGSDRNNNGSTPSAIPNAQTHPEQTSPESDLAFSFLNGILSYNIGQDSDAPGIPPPQSAQPGAPSQPGETAQPGAGGETPGTQANANQTPSSNDTLHDILLRLRDMLSDVGQFRTMPFMLPGGIGFGEPDPDDPERAKKLVDGLEDVPVGLVRRLVQVGGTGGGMGYDDNKGGDAGCAICWDTLLDSEGEGFGKQSTTETEEVPSDEKPSSPPDLETKQQPKVVSLPCAHVFHADCLIPWFSRPHHTTCPTCRFNIDPDNLTYSPPRRQQEQGQDEATPTTDGAPPAAETNTPQEPNITLGGDFLNWIPVAQAANTAGPNPSAPSVSPSSTTAAAAPEPNAGAAGPTTDGRQTMSFQTPNGFVTVTQVLAPFEIHTHAGNPGRPNGTRRFFFHPRPLNPRSLIERTNEHQPFVGSISIPFPQAQAPNPGQVPQPQTQSEPVRQDPHPSLNSLFPASFFRLGGQPQPQPQATETRPEQPGNAVPGQFVRSLIRPSPANYWVPILVYRRRPSLRLLGSRTQGPLPPLPNHTPVPNFPRMFSPFDLFSRRPGGGTNATNATPAAPAPGTTPAAPAPGTTTADANQPPTPADPNSTNNPPEEAEFIQVTFDMVVGTWPPLGRDGQPFTGPQVPPSGVPQNAGATPPAPTGPGPTPDRHPAERLDEGLRDVLAALRANVQTRAESRGQPQPSDDEPPAETEDGSLPASPSEGFRHEDTQRLLEETRRNVDSFLSRMMQFRTPLVPQGADQAPVNAQPQGEQQQANPNQQPQEPNTAAPPPPQMRFQTFPNFDFFGAGRTKRPWTLPSAPGPSLRQRIERREFDAGLRCNDVSCGVGPSDEEPCPSALADNAGATTKRVFIKAKGVGGKDVCSHTFHTACLVREERVVLRGVEASVDSDGCVEVSCPVCRSVGCVLKEEWDEGTVALQ